MATDAELLEAWRAGDRLAGNTLFEKHFGSVRRFFANKVNEDEVEDLIQRTFTGCVEGVDRFRGDSRFRTYLFGIARFQLLRFLREQRNQGERMDPDMSVESVMSLGRTPTSILAARAEEAILISALQHVSVDHQTMLELHYWEELPNEDIAGVFGINPTTVRTRLHRARKALAGVIDAELERRGSARGSMDIDATARGVCT